MRIFAGVPLEVAPNDSGVAETGQRFMIFLLPFKMTSRRSYAHPGHQQ